MTGAALMNRSHGLEHGICKVVTRNVRHFIPTGVQVLESLQPESPPNAFFPPLAAR